MNKQRRQQPIDLVRSIGAYERTHSTHIVKTIDLRAKCCIPVIIAPDKITIVFGGDSTLSVHLNATRPPGDLAMHVLFGAWNFAFAFRMHTNGPFVNTFRLPVDAFRFRLIFRSTATISKVERCSKMRKNEMNYFLISAKSMPHLGSCPQTARWAFERPSALV